MRGLEEMLTVSMQTFFFPEEEEEDPEDTLAVVWVFVQLLFMTLLRGLTKSSQYVLNLSFLHPLCSSTEASDSFWFYFAGCTRCPSRLRNTRSFDSIGCFFSVVVFGAIGLTVDTCSCVSLPSLEFNFTRYLREVFVPGSTATCGTILHHGFQDVVKDSEKTLLSALRQQPVLSVCCSPQRVTKLDHGVFAVGRGTVFFEPCESVSSSFGVSVA